MNTPPAHPRSLTRLPGAVTWHLSRPFRHRLARRDYWRSLRLLYTAETAPARAALLERMAADADQSGPGPDWLARADILRYVACATRGWVPAGISDSDREGDLLGPRYRDEWADLALAEAAGNRHVTGAVLRSLAAGTASPAAADLLRLIARTELAVAEAAGRSR